MNIALASTACGQILTLFEFAFSYPDSKESKERGKQLEELEHCFDLDNDSSGNEDTVSKKQDEKEAATQFADAEVEPKLKKHRFGKCQDNLKDLVPINKVTPILPSTRVKLSETGVPHKSYSDHSESEGQSIYHCFLIKPDTEIPCTYYMAQMAAMCMHIWCKHMKICIKCRLCA